MNKIIGISLIEHPSRAAVYQYEAPVLIPRTSSVSSRFAAAKADSAAFLGSPATEAVAVVPSFYTLQQRDALIREAQKEGLTLKRFLSPAAAAALQDYRRKRDFYTEESDADDVKNLLICCLTGGIFDATAAEFSNGIIEVVATAGIDSQEPEAVRNTLHRLLKESELSEKSFHRVLLIGDACCLPEIQSLILSCVTGEIPVGVYGAEDLILGAAILCGILEGHLSGILLLNALPHSLGIGTGDGSFIQLLEQHSTIPTSGKHVFTNTADNQTAFEFCVYEGESANALQNQRVTCLQSTELSPCPKGTAQIEITLSMDANGILNVTAKDLISGKQLNLHHANPGLNKFLKPLSENSEKTADKTSPPNFCQTAVPPELKEWVVKFLPVYDDLALALEQPTKDEAFKKGVHLTMKKLTAVFSQLGVEFYGIQGECFDPKFHNAVIHIESPQYGENTIVKVLQKGVKLNGSIIRYAMVQVAN